MMFFILPQSVKQNNRRKAESKLKRAKFLSKVSTDFTASELASANNLKLGTAQDQLRKMVHCGEVTELNEYGTPRRYRKAIALTVSDEGNGDQHE
jgi:hypothetical protein